MNSTFFAFDIDGVIVDSEAVHFRSLQKVVGNKNLPITPDKLIGLSLEETLIQSGVRREEIKNFSDKIEETYVKMINRSNVRDGVLSTIDSLIKKCCSYGFVSSASRKVCEANLSLLGLPSDYLLVSRDDVTLTKPNAEPYLKLCSTAGFEPRDTVAIEDSDTGIAAAHAAGIRKIYAWPHSLSGSQKYDLSYRVIEKLDDIEEISLIKGTGSPHVK